MNQPHGRILLEPNELYLRHSEASLIQLANGNLLLAWSRFMRGISSLPRDAQAGLPQFIQSDNNRGHIAGMLSSDNGLTWHDEHIIAASATGLNVMSPALIRLANGELGLVDRFRESTANASRMFCHSTDEGQTWSAPTRITPDGYITGCHDRLNVLASGRILVPLHSTADWHSHYLHIRFAWSDNHGYTWQLGEPITLPHVSDSGESGCNEPGVVQLADGSLLMICRTAMGTIFRAESDDDGETWHDLRSLEVVAPVAPSLLRRIPNTHDLLLIWNWHYNWQESLGGLRRPLACAISTDGGKSFPWSRRKILEDDAALTFAYPSCTFVGDDAIVTYYVAVPDDALGRRSLKITHIPIAWLYD